METKTNSYLNIKTKALILMFLVVSTLAVYMQIRGFQFFIFDDTVYVTDNTRVQNGLTLENIRWAFCSMKYSNWHPITWLSHMLDCQLYGMYPGGHHITNLLFHIFNTLLLFIVFHGMTGSLWRSGFVAALFALHPMHVESVAWIAERKDVLSTFFWILTMGCYIRYVKHPTIYRYILIIFSYMLGLMSKPMVVTLPFVLILLDYWPLKRFVFKRTLHGERTFHLALIVEKIPLLLLTMISCILTYLAQYHGRAVISFDKIPFSLRFSNAIVSYLIYAYKMILPMNMAVLYPFPSSMNYLIIIIAIITISFITFAVIKLSVRYAYLAVGWFWFLGTLLPVIGLIQIGHQARADRYTYIPYIGLFIIVSWGISSLLQRYPCRKAIIALLAGIYVTLISSITWLQASYWSNSIKLFTHTIKVTKNNSTAHNNLGSVYAMNGLIDRAVRHFEQAQKIDPEDRLTYSNLGRAYRIQGRINDAIYQYQTLLKMTPKDVNVVKRLAAIYASKRNYKKSIVYLKKWMQLQPKNPYPYYYISSLYAGLNNREEAIEWLEKALEKGFNKWELLENDKNFNDIRKTEDFRKRIQ